jgi:hypothetical protein
LKLAAVFCRVVRQSGLISAPVVSPDARSIAYYDSIGLLRVGRLDGGDGWTEYPADLGTFARFASEPRTTLAFAWSADSRFLWSATHEKMHPSGFALTPMQPVRTAGDGQLQELPKLEHAAGPLDALLWAGSDGLAVAQFGTRGGYYRPQHDDVAPTFAIVDASRGLAIDALPFASVPSLLEHRGHSPRAAVKNAAARVLRDGRVRALLSVGAWVVWTSGEAPRIVPDPYVGQSHSQMVLAPDGSTVLVARLLRTDGGMCGRTGGCRPGRPVEGVLAAAHDLASGRALWAIRATATADHEFPAPAISDDGRHALVGLMPQTTGPIIALVAMQDGTIVQTLPTPGGPYAMGFARGGATVWAHAHGVTALYDLQLDAR